MSGTTSKPGGRINASSDVEAFLAISDPASLLQWRGNDRAIVTFSGAPDLAAKRKPFAEIIRFHFGLKYDASDRVPPACRL